MHHSGHHKQIKAARAYALFEMLLALALVAVSFTAGFSHYGSEREEQKTRRQKAMLTTLNCAMETYRAWVARGYSPETPWAAETEEGVIAELVKPLSRGAETVSVLSETQTISIADEGIEISEATPRGVWQTARSGE